MGTDVSKTEIVYNAIPEEFRNQIPDVFVIVFEVGKVSDSTYAYVACGINYHFIGTGHNIKAALERLKYNVVSTAFINHHVGNSSPFDGVYMLDTFSLRAYSGYGIVKTVNIKQEDLPT